MKKIFNSKGFTFFELLIVLVVIGVLSSTLMLSGSQSVSSAKASNIISGLTAFKTALVHWYTDNRDIIIKSGDEYKIDANKLKAKENLTDTINNLGDLMQKQPKLVTKYIDAASKFKFDKKNYSSEATQGTYRFEDSGRANNRKTWFVGYALTDSELASGVGEKLAAKATSLNLFASQGTTGIRTSSGFAQKVTIKPYNGGKVVWMKVLELEEPKEE